MYKNIVRYMTVGEPVTIGLKPNPFDMEPVKIRDVEEAQSKIVNVIRTPEDKGVIVIVRGQGEGMLV